MRQKEQPFKKVLQTIVVLAVFIGFAGIMRNPKPQEVYGVSDIPRHEVAKENIADYVLKYFFPNNMKANNNYDAINDNKGEKTVKTNSLAKVIQYVLPNIGGGKGIDDAESVIASNILDFEDVPDGKLYFTDEDTYRPEDSINPLLLGIPDNTAIPIVESPKPIEIKNKKASILIYHTHSSESYMPNNQSNYHSIDEKYNVINAGKILTSTLEKKYKLTTVHDKTYHDRESYSMSYSNSLKTIKTQMAKNKEMKIIIDVHRDAFSVANEGQKKESKAMYTTNINGKKAAKIMLVVGKKNQNYTELEKFAVSIQKKMNIMYPGLLLKVSRPEKKYNQYNSNYSILIEMGCMLNTTEEAAYSSELMGNVLGEVINDMKK